jgi:hypothetical protein
MPDCNVDVPFLRKHWRQALDMWYPRQHHLEGMRGHYLSSYEDAMRGMTCPGPTDLDIAFWKWYEQCRNPQSICQQMTNQSWIGLCAFPENTSAYRVFKLRAQRDRDKENPFISKERGCYTNTYCKK